MSLTDERVPAGIQERTAYPMAQRKENKDAAHGWFPSHVPHPYLRSDESLFRDHLNWTMLLKRQAHFQE